jgi:hypothetical protein
LPTAKVKVDDFSPRICGVIDRKPWGLAHETGMACVNYEFPSFVLDSILPIHLITRKLDALCGRMDLSFSPEGISRGALSTSMWPS